MAKNCLVSLLTILVLYPLLDWIRDGVFSWDSVLHALILALFVGILNLPLIIGSYEPPKKKE